MADDLTSSEQSALIWPIKAQGAVMRLMPLGDPTISQFYQNSMEQGRFLESSIADANNQLLQKKVLLNEYIISYTHMNQLAVDGQLGQSGRVPKYVADSISILQTAQRLTSEITNLVNAIYQNIEQIVQIEQAMLQMVQTAENSLANLLNNICNWGIPALPSMPNLFDGQIWDWNGFNFSPLALFAALRSNTTFNFNFTFANCNVGAVATGNLFVGDPITITTASGLTYSSPANYDPPLNGTQTSTTQDLTDPVFIAQMQGQNTPPVYNPNFNPNTEMYGAVPDPHQIISNYQMPAATYAADIVSICPFLRSNTIFVTDSDYSNPNYGVRTPELRKDLLHFITLAEIVQSNYDPFVVSAWLLYLNVARQGRGGVWIPNFETVYNTYLQPSIGSLLTLTVPWNDVLPGVANILWMGTWTTTTAYVTNDVVVFNSVNYIALADNTDAEPDTSPASWTLAPVNSVYSDAPVIPFITTLQGLPSNHLPYILWQLSYIEASLLSYSRNSTWDTSQDTSYLTGPTGSDLDYIPTAITGTLSGLTLGEGVAEFPVPITFPTAMKTVMDAVIAISTTNINNDTTYLSPRLGNRYTYNQFAVATQVDRFSQFWRDFATNLTNFLAQDPYLVQFAVTYPDILDGALDPLANSTNSVAYASLQSDVASRNRTWTPGTPLLNIPIQPVTGLTNNSSPNVNTNGWIVPPTDLDPIAFLARPDISVLPIPVQTAMLRTNLSYAGINVWKSNMQASIATNLANANALLTATQQIGFDVEIAADSITATSSTSNVLTVLEVNSYLPGDLVLIQGTDESFLNGQVVTIIAASATQFTCATPNAPQANYSNPSDSGTTGLVTIVTTGLTGTSVNFDTIIFDYTNNVTTLRPGLFTIQTVGTYSGVGQIIFLGTENGFGTVVPNASTGQFTVTVFQNATVIATVSSAPNANPSLTNPVVLPFTFNGNFSILDTVTIIASHNLSVPQVVDIGSNFSMVQNQVTPPPPSPSSGSDTQTFTVTSSLPAWFGSTSIPPQTAVYILPNGTVTPIDPFVAAVTNVAESAGSVLTITCSGGHHFVIGDLVVFSGIGVAAYLNGVVVTVLASGLTTTVFTANDPTTHGTYPSTPDTGSVLYAIDASGAVLAPFMDGITMAAAAEGATVQVATSYGDVFTPAGSPFTEGGLIYAGVGGLLTQNYTAVVTQVGWIIVVGRANTTTEFIFEPHIPTRTTIL